jgi:hypothetical protein
MYIDRKIASRRIYDSIMESGPSYKLIVHESPTWLSIKDELSNKNLIEIISKKKGQEYIEIVDRYFAPVSEIGQIKVNGTVKDLAYNLIINHRKYLTYLLIAQEHSARIGDLVSPSIELISKSLEASGDLFSEEAIIKTKFVETIINSYNLLNIPSFSTNGKIENFNELQSILDNEKIKFYSEMNYRFCYYKSRKDALIHQLRDVGTEILQDKLLPLFLISTFTPLRYFEGTPNYFYLLQTFTGILALFLRDQDFRLKAPPFQKLNYWDIDDSGALSYTQFNYIYRNPSESS